MKRTLSLTCLPLLVCVSFTAPSSAKADVDVELVALIGTGVDTGDAANNPYALQLGGAVDLNISDYVLGVRVIRSLGRDASCAGCTHVNDLLAIGGDLGFDWEFAILHVSPRLGLGGLRERDGDRRAFYFEPGGVAEVELGWFAAGVDVRYRAAVGESDMNGLLVLARLGLRF